ncbi:MAG: hypothetical protein K0S08_17 [Gammaproteobacteria bacterium]|jgi:hypothetical protein|nr:hypothetical protein [Gammaproteobacteria bacterium]
MYCKTFVKLASLILVLPLVVYAQDVLVHTSTIRLDKNVPPNRGVPGGYYDIPPSMSFGKWQNARCEVNYTVPNDPTVSLSRRSPSVETQLMASGIHDYLMNPDIKDDDCVSQSVDLGNIPGALRVKNDDFRLIFDSKHNVVKTEPAKGEVIIYSLNPESERRAR